MIEGKGVMRMKRRTQYVKWGLTAFLTVCAVLVFYDTFYMGGTLQHFVNKLFSVLAPVLYGCAIAYLLTPVMNWIERALHAGWQKAFPRKHVKNAAGVLRFASILLAEAVAILLVYLLMSVLIPQLVDSVTMLINNAEAYYYKVYNWADGLLDSENEIAVWVADFVTKYYSDGVTLLKDHILPWAQGALGTLTGGIWNGIWSVVSFATDLIVGIIVSIYLMTMKEKSLARCCKVVYAVLDEKKANAVIHGARQVDRIFSGFVRGKLLDSLIIGALCFIGCSILKMPYTPLVSVVVGVTNVIPFFGPFIGAVPATLLILIQSPIKALWFVLFVLVLQQLDGNVIGPKILGNTTGLSSFWVLFAILLFGGLWGFVGMIVGVPLFAVIYDVIKKLVIHGLKRNKEIDLLQTYHDNFGDPEDDVPVETSASEASPAEANNL